MVERYVGDDAGAKAHEKANWRGNGAGSTGSILCRIPPTRSRHQARRAFASPLGILITPHPKSRIRSALAYRPRCRTRVACQPHVIFLAHNLRLLRHGSQMGIIVPNGTVTGEPGPPPVARVLMTSHAVHSVIELPSRAFPDTDATTFILTLGKGGPSPNRILSTARATMHHSVSRTTSRLKKRRLAWVTGVAPGTGRRPAMPYRHWVSS